MRRFLNLKPIQWLTGFIARLLPRRAKDTMRRALGLPVTPVQILEPPRAVEIERERYELTVIQPQLPHEEADYILSTPIDSVARKQLDVVCFSIIDWDFRFQRPQQIMTQFAKHGHRVFYISISRFLGSEASPKYVVRTVAENVIEISLATHQHPNVYGESLSDENLKVLMAALEELRRAYGIEEAISYVMIASWTRLALKIRRQWGWRVLYDCMDEWDNFPLITRTILDAEIELVRECDLLVVTSKQLYEKWKDQAHHTVLARNATDYEFYEEKCRPNSIFKKPDRPVVGYYGAIAEWFDLDLMLHIAKNRPQYHFVLLGGVFDVDVSELQALPNVSLLGQQPYASMPRYLYHFDACLIPFKVNPITEATDPVKLYEYLSGGKPVVSINLSELKPYRELLYLAEDYNDFLSKLDEAVSENDAEMVERRKAFAWKNSWKSRYELIMEGIRHVTPQAGIVIVNYKNHVLVKLCLESILRNTAYPYYEIVVVDNNSVDGTPEYLRAMAKAYDHIKVICNETNKGFAGANNQGIHLSTAERLVLLNNDTVVTPGWLSRLIYHIEDPEVGMVGSVSNAVYNEAWVETNYTTYWQMESFAGELAHKYHRQIADIHMLAMYCVAFRRDVFNEVGPLDERFGIGMFEDDDYSLRMHKKGLRVVCALDVFIHHFGQASFRMLKKDGRYMSLFEENRKKYEAKWELEWQQHEKIPLEPHYHEYASRSMTQRNLTG